MLNDNAGMRHVRALILFIAVLSAVGSLDAEWQAATAAPAALVARVVASYPHDRNAFTQGLALVDGVLYESTGLVGRSSLRRVDLATGTVRQQAPMPPPYFGEGLAVAGPRLFMLTWQHQRVFVHDRKTFARVGEFGYTGEGWGLCHDGRALVMSSGSDTLTVRSPETFAVQRSVRVTESGRPLDKLNELECVGTDVYANVWTTDSIVRIDMRSGRVTARIDASGLLSPLERTGVDVLNGIAHDPANGTFLLTGKLWPRLFRVRFEPAAPK